MPARPDDVAEAAALEAEPERELLAVVDEIEVMVEAWVRARASAVALRLPHF